MNQKEAVERALIVFPKLYYFVPPIKPFAVKVLPERVERLAEILKIKKADAKIIDIEKPLDTILWLLSTLSIDRGQNEQTNCSQSNVRDIVTRWTPMSKGQFTKELAKLRAADLITSSRTEFGDRRRNELALTAKGIEVLEKIKDQRRDILSFLYQKRSQIEIKMVTDALEVVSLATWPKMKEAMTDLNNSKS